MFGRSLEEKARKAKTEQDKIEKPQIFYAEYLGGHKAHPEKKDVDVYVYADRIELDQLYLAIPYKSITNIETMDEEKFRKRRAVALGLIFLPLALVAIKWKKHFRYTVIEYHDGDFPQSLILDFGKKVEIAQSTIYNKMVQVRHHNNINKDVNKVEN